MTDVALIACDHGLGHVRRCVLIADALVAEGAEVSLFAPDGAARRVRRALGLPASPGVREVAFATRTSPEALRRGDPEATRWEERLPDLDRFDHVVADTLPEVLALRPDAVIVAQFLWHDVLDGTDPAYARRAQGLLAAAGAVVGSEPFAMPAVRALPGFRAVGLHSSLRPDPSRARGHDLLVAGGTTPALDGPLRAFVAGLLARSTGDAEAAPGPFRAVHVDRALLPTGAAGARLPVWLREAEHTPALYDTLAAAVIRPGLGTLTELLARGVTVHCAYEAGNAELVHNAHIVAGLGGEDLGTPPSDDLDDWLQAALERVLAARPAAPAAPLRLDGAAETARIVLGAGHAARAG